MPAPPPDDFRTEAQATLQMLGTAVEEGRMSLPLAALQLSALYRRHGIVMSEVTAGVTIVRWVGSRPAAADSPETCVPPGEATLITRLRAQIQVLTDLLDRSTSNTVPTEELHRMRESRACILHGMGHTIEETGALR